VSDREEFDRRYKAFQEATQFYSSFTYHTEDAIKAHEHLLALGPKIVLANGLRVLQNSPSAHLINVLCEVADAHPVKHENRGYVRKMADDWIEWGRLRGIQFDAEEIVPNIWDDIPVATDEYP
jgi:hypothetical protein